MSEQNVKRRHVFYLPGYDPFHPRRYRELYRKESKEQARISGYEISLSPKTGSGPYGWHVRSVQDGFETDTEIEVLVWHDIVKDSMEQGLLETYRQLFKTAWLYIGSGALFRLMKLRKGPMIAALYPIVFLLAQLIFAVVASFSVFSLLNSLFDEYMIVSIALAVGAAFVAYTILELFRRYDGKVFAHYLMHDYAFSAQYGGANPPMLTERMQEFGREIASRADDDEVDEILVVGHSSGAHLAVSILADLVRQKRVSKGKVGFLSLGHVVPMVSFLPKANVLRADLNLMGKQDIVTWIDISAPGDGCAFSLCDPVRVTGVADDKTFQPLVLSAAFTQTLSPERWKALRWKFFRLHFQYLCAFDRPGHYDYFKITSGYQSLSRMFEGRMPSKSRLVEPVNKFTEID